MIASASHNKKSSIHFEIECLQHVVPLRSLARHLAVDSNEADDLLQDTLLRGYRFFHKFKTQTDCKAWLFRIMRNVFINRYKQNKKHNMVRSLDLYLESDIKCEVPSNISYGDPEKAILSNIFKMEVKKALDIIPQKYRDVVILADIHCYPYSDIAKLLECPIGTVRSRLYRGRKLLRKHIK